MTSAAAPALPATRAPHLTPSARRMQALAPRRLRELATRTCSSSCAAASSRQMDRRTAQRRYTLKSRPSVIARAVQAAGASTLRTCGSRVFHATPGSSSSSSSSPSSPSASAAASTAASIASSDRACGQSDLTQHGTLWRMWKAPAAMRGPLRTHLWVEDSVDAPLDIGQRKQPRCAHRDPLSAHLRLVRKPVDRTEHRPLACQPRGAVARLLAAAVRLEVEVVR